MISRLRKLALSLGITFLLGSSFIPLGCGGSEQAFTPVLRGHKDPEVPENVVRELKECVKQAPDRLARGHTEFPEHHIQFNVHITEEDGVDTVEVKESTLQGGQIEACMASALRGLTLPIRDIAFEQHERTQKDSPSPESRAMMGSPALAVLAPVSLTPVVVAGLAIIVVVAIVIYVATDEPPAVDCQRVKEECIATCSETSLPTPDHGAKFRKCMRACMAAKGCVF